MEWKLELVAIPVTDVDRAISFYSGQVGFNLDHDHTVNDQVRFVQLTPPGSACSIAIGTGVDRCGARIGQGMQVVVPDAAAAREHLLKNGVEASELQEFPWGKFVFFSDPDGNAWAVQQLPPRP